MRAHYCQHVPFEGLGSIEGWLKTIGYTISRTALYKDEPLPTVQDIDMLIIMGGPMSVHDEDKYPWLIQEKAFIREAIASKVPTLGICLGAQLIAQVLGGEVVANPVKEIGWFLVEAVQPACDSSFHFPETIDAFHWHGETFTLPPGSIHLATSKGCAHQAFHFGKHVLALQFHLETTLHAAHALVENCGDEITQGPYIQNEKDILCAPSAHYHHINELMGKLLAELHHSL